MKPELPFIMQPNGRSYTQVGNSTTELPAKNCTSNHCCPVKI